MNITINHTSELGQRSVFDMLYDLLERDNSRSKDFSINDLYELIGRFDLEFQKFNSSSAISNRNILNEILRTTMMNFISVFTIEGFRDEPIYYAFQRYIKFFILVLRECADHSSSNDLERMFQNNFPSFTKYNISTLNDELVMAYLDEKTNPEKKEIPLSPISLFQHELFQEIGHNPTLDEQRNLVIYTKGFIEKEITWNAQLNDYEIIHQNYYMYLDIEIENNSSSANKLITPLWLITSSLENIDNVKVKIENLEMGSLKSRLKISMRNLVAKEEVKAVLQTGAEVAIKAITGVSHSEVQKTNTETKKIKLETEKLTEEISTLPSKSEIALDRKLERDLKKLEIEQKKLELAQGKLAMIEKLSDLVAKGIIESDSIRIDINDFLLIIKENDTLSIGPDINEIT